MNPAARTPGAAHLEKNMKCTNCNDTGSIPGSFYLDCASCEVASEKKHMQDFLHMLPIGTTIDECYWAIWQRMVRAEHNLALAQAALKDAAIAAEGKS